jgi:hypothetical protein
MAFLTPKNASVKNLFLALIFPVHRIFSLFFDDYFSLMHFLFYGLSSTFHFPLFCALRSLSHQIFGLVQKEVRPAILPPRGISTTPKKKQTALVCACHLVMITEPRTAHIEFEKKR